MPVKKNDPVVHVTISRDRLIAELVIPAGAPRETITLEHFVELLEQSGVVCNDSVREELHKIIANPPAPETALRVVVARGKPAIHGEDGRIDWIKRSSQEMETGDENQINYYERSAYIMVGVDEVLARIIEPTAGEHGCDVAGEPLPAKPGKIVQINFDKSVIRDGQNQLIAKKAGVLHKSKSKVYVEELLQVAGDVDFSTGKIDFKGDVSIRGDVRDCFVVKAAGNISVQGVIERATVHAGGDLIAKGGIAGGDSGSIQVGNHLVARYLKNVKADVGGDLCVEREALNCMIAVGGALRIVSGAMMGGHIVVKGPIEVAALGSGAGVVTVLTLPSPETLELVVSKRLFAGVVLNIGQQVFKFKDEIRGPLRIFRNNKGWIVARQGPTSMQLLSQYPGVSSSLA